MYEKNRSSFEELLSKVVDHLENSENNSGIKTKEDQFKSIALNSNFNRNAQDIREKSKKEISKEAPLKALDIVFNKLCNIDVEELDYFNTSAKNTFVQKANEIIEKLNEFVEKIENK